MKIKWINPREKLPAKDQLVWIIYGIHRADERGTYSSSQCCIAKINVGKYGILHADEIDHKGLEGYRRIFTSWSPDECYYSDHYNFIYAWAPFDEDDLPIWNYLTEEESQSMITSSEEYKKQIAIEEQDRVIAEATKGQMCFISLKDEKPLRSGLYVVATKNHTALSMYDISSEHLWIVNGETVIAWYPVPSHYPD